MCITVLFTTMLETMKEFANRRSRLAALIVVVLVLMAVGILFILIFHEHEPEPHPIDDSFTKIGLALDKAAPDLYYEPDYPIIKFNKSVPSSYKIYIDELNDFLAAYSKTDDTVPCRRNKENNQKMTTKSCQIELNHNKELIRDCMKPDFGFGSGTPCFLFHLDPVLNFLPQVYVEETDRPKIVRDYPRKVIPVACTDRQKNKMGHSVPLRWGIPHKFFPYKKTFPNYHIPFVFYKFENLELGKKHVIECEAYGPNLIYGAKIEMVIKMSA